MQVWLPCGRGRLLFLYCVCVVQVLKVPVSRDMLGRVFNGSGKPIDGGCAPHDHCFNTVTAAPGPAWLCLWCLNGQLH